VFSIDFNYILSTSLKVRILKMTKDDIMTVKELADYLKIAEKTASN
jgi:DNA-binding CsgD family transcriptional regulator